MWKFLFRFLYHFTGTRQTNRLDKPEWFYTQILSWAKESNLFVAQTFQSAALLAYQENLNVRVMRKWAVVWHEHYFVKSKHFSAGIYPRTRPINHWKTVQWHRTNIGGRAFIRPFDRRDIVVRTGIERYVRISEYIHECNFGNHTAAVHYEMVVGRREM